MKFWTLGMNPSTAIQVQQSPFPKFERREVLHDIKVRQYVGDEVAPD